MSRQRREEQLERERMQEPGRWLLGRLLPYGATLAFLLVLGKGGGNQMLIPFAAVALFWGMGIARAYLSYQDDRRRIGVGASVTPVPAELAVQAPVAPVRAVSSAVVDLVALCAQVQAGLRKQGEIGLAERLQVGLDESDRLGRLVEAAGGTAEQESELQVEVEALRAKALAARDEEARALWTRNAEVAGRRLGKLADVALAVERAEARIEAFRQLLKSLAVDVARLELAASVDGGALAERAREIESQVDLLVRTQRELAALDGRMDAPNPALGAMRARQGVAG